MTTEKRVTKYTLDNGLQLFVCPKACASKVSLQLWYNVGSKHEQPGEKGMAHFIEHMIFKGTQKMLSESDINLVAQKLSAEINAATSFDYTTYFFDVPVANWQQVLPIFADCMQNCRFDQEHMNSEVKAVIQELKMYKDEFMWVLAEAMVTAIFESHPYHYPIIGYKQDLWQLQRDTLLQFYKKYYVPNNAYLVIVGDVQPENVLQQVEQFFGYIPRGAQIERDEFFINEELQAKKVVVYKDVQQALCTFVFAIPGTHQKLDFFYDILGLLLANGKGSRLHKILADQLGLATSVEAMTYDLIDQELFFITVKPKQELDIDRIKEIVLQQIVQLAQEQIPALELRRAVKLADVEHQHVLQDIHKQAQAIGKSVLTTGDEEYPFNYCQHNPATLMQDLQALLCEYFRPSLCHEGRILKTAASDQEYAHRLQEKSDQLDTKILFGKERTSQVEPGKYVDKVQVEKFKNHTFITPHVATLSNGLKLLTHHDTQIDLVECVLEYKATSHFDGKDTQGLSYLVSKLMLEGTKNYPGELFIQEAESYGISFDTAPGSISVTMLSDDLEKGFELLGEMLQAAAMTQERFDSLVAKTQAQLVQFWDTPTRCIKQVAMQELYQQHPAGLMALGTLESLSAMTLQQCVDFYQEKVSAYSAVLSVVGNFKQQNIADIAQKYLGSWRNPKIDDVVYPALPAVQPREILISKNRDQVVLAFAGLSIARTDEHYNELAVFDQLLAGGMSSRLFELREQSGLFYTIGGSVVAGADKYPGMIYVRTIVSKDRLDEAQKVIANCLNQAIETIEPEEFEQAKEMIINNIAMAFETYGDIAHIFLFLEKYNFAPDYLQQRIEAIRELTLQQMQEVVRAYVATSKMITIKIGRV